VIWHTGDGGRIWELQESDTDSTLSSVFFVDSQHGWAVGDNGTIVRTADGGQNWTRQGSPVALFHRDVFFVTQSKGWVASEKTHILYTEDGGETWEIQFQDEIYNLTAITFSDDEHGWTVGEYGFTYRTEDGGKNWEHQAGYFRVNDETGDIDTGVTLFDVIGLDGMTGLAVGADGVVTKTEDGGGTWKRVDGDFPAVPFFGAAYDGVDSIVIGGRGAYFYSPDKGKTWKEAVLRPSMAYRWIYGFDHVGTGRFVGVGEEGAIYVGEVASLLERVNY
jgi:photosystem II stability/assembly factor-like uncharacterized protein